MFFIITQTSAAEDAETLGGLKDSAASMGYGWQDSKLESEDIADRVGKVINYFLSLIGIIFFSIVWLGAFDIVGANGDSELLKKGKARIKNGAIGIFVVFVAYIFTYVIINLISGEGVFKV
jgi:hypothetical protein